MIRKLLLRLLRLTETQLERYWRERALRAESLLHPSPRMKQWIDSHQLENS